MLPDRYVSVRWHRLSPCVLDLEAGHVLPVPTEEQAREVAGWFNAGMADPNSGDWFPACGVAA